MSDGPVSPGISDSDVIYLVIRRLERAADLMVKHEYGLELDQHLNKVGELMEWLAAVMQARDAG